jgi:hypothetical protein
MGVVSSRCCVTAALFHEDTSPPIFARFTTSDYGHVCMLIGGCVNQLCGETPTDLRIGVPVHVTNVVSFSVTLTETQRKATINAPYLSNQDARTLKYLLEMRHQRFVTLGISTDSHNGVVWVTSQFSGPLKLVA